MSNILIVEDEDIIRNALKKLLQRNGFTTSEAASIDAAKEFNFADFQLVISDLRLPGGQGTDLIKLAGKTPVLIMTSYASMRSAVDAMKQGAVDYIAKPFDHTEMVETVQRILSDSSTDDDDEDETDALEASMKTARLIGNSPAMQSVFDNIEKVSPTDTSVIIYGETGTGKELVATAIHQKSPRAAKPLISFNCAAIPENLIEAELFGHEKGAFSGADSARSGLIAAADSGTLFLDEIGELPLEAQARLLRVLEEGEVRSLGAVTSRQIDLRLIVATHRDLQQLCREGKFREDLFFRINVFQINLPPLRERQQDLLELTTAFLESSCNKLNKAVPAIPAETQTALLEHHWPGNVRELKNAIERAAILIDESSALLPEHLELQQTSTNTTSAVTPASSAPSPSEPDRSKVSLDDYFVSFVLENEKHMSETELAKQLGISRKNLWERRQKLGIPRKKK